MRQVPGPLPFRWTLFATRSCLRANARASAWDALMFRSASGYPSTGWAERAGVEGWGVFGPISGSKADRLNHALAAPDAPWADAACSDDMRSALSAKARQLAGHPLSAVGGAWVLRQIPPSRLDLDVHFRLFFSSLDPDWHERAPDNDPWMRRLGQADDDWREDIARAKKSQEAFLEAAQIQEASEPFGDPEGRPGASTRRL